MLKIDFFMVLIMNSIAKPWEYIINYSGLIIFGVISLLVGSGVACSTICIMVATMAIGQSVSRFVGLPHMRILATSSKCIDCKIFDNTRVYFVNLSE